MANKSIPFRATADDLRIIRKAKRKKGVQAVAEIIRMALRALERELDKEN